MAKGDKQALQSTVDQSTGTAQQNLSQNITNTNQMNQEFINNWRQALANSNSNYSGIMGGYSNAMSAVDDPNSATNRAKAGYSNFADTGGFSPEDIAQIQNQAAAPIRGMYEGAMRKVQQGGMFGGAPNTGAAMAKLMRESSYSANDAANQAAANIAQLRSQNKLYGMQGMVGADASQSGMRNNILSGMRSLYGTTPATTSMFGNQVMSGFNQANQQQGMLNDIGRMRINGQSNVAQVPGDFIQGVNNVTGAFRPIGTAAGALSSIFT